MRRYIACLALVILGFGAEPGLSQTEQPLSGENQKSGAKNSNSARKASEKSSPSPASSDDSADVTREPAKSSNYEAKPANTEENNTIATHPKAPSWLLGLGLSATPNSIFDSSLFSALAVIGQSKESDKVESQGSNSSTYSRRDTLGVTVDYRFITPSQKIFWQIGADASKILDRSSSSITLEGVTSKSSGETNVDYPGGNFGVGFQALPGLWVGTNYTWSKVFTKVEEPDLGFGSAKYTLRNELASQTAGIEYRGWPAHAGFEYTIKNSGDTSSTSWSMPMRLALTDKLFVGATLGGGKDEEVASTIKTLNSSFASEIGIQGAASTYTFEFEYSVEKSGASFSDAPSTRTIKTKSGRINAVFGSQQGLRILLGAAYDLNNSFSNYGEKSQSEGGQLAIGIARAQ